MKKSASERNLSILYLALACLLYYPVASGFTSSLQASTDAVHSGSTIYIETLRDGRSTVRVINEPGELKELSEAYGLRIKNGDKIMLENDTFTNTGRISGIKSISLGVPIGINTAEARDLAALPGIGDKLAERIIVYRKNSGGFKSLDELRSVEGIGDKKLEALRSKASLD